MYFLRNLSINCSLAYFSHHNQESAIFLSWPQASETILNTEVISRPLLFFLFMQIRINCKDEKEPSFFFKWLFSDCFIIITLVMMIHRFGDSDGYPFFYQWFLSNFHPVAWRKIFMVQLKLNVMQWFPILYTWLTQSNISWFKVELLIQLLFNIGSFHR